MDDVIRKCCPNCSQTYHLKLQSSTAKGNLPLFLACGHSTCENCIRNIVKFMEPIECKICHRDMILEAGQVAQIGLTKNKLYEYFPINYQVVGELTVQHLEKSESDAKVEKEYFVDLQAIMEEGSSSKAVCAECHQPTTKMCQQCDTILCDACFTKSHKNFVIFKNHVLRDIDEMISPAVCKIHKDKPLDYYCNDCKKCNCMDCLMVGGEKSCKNHNVVSMQEVNDGFLEELNEITPKVDETFRRLTKTAYDVGHILHNVENGTGSVSELDQIIGNIEQHFSKLCAIVQKHKQEVVTMVTKLKRAEKESLYNAKSNLVENIKKGKKVLDLIKMTASPKKVKQMNLAVLLEDAKQVADSPWYLNRDESKKDPLKVAVNEDLCPLISDYIHLEGNASSAYKLLQTSELDEGVEIPAPPPAPVFAPVLPKDVRQTKGKTKQKEAKVKEESYEPPTFFRNAPQYRSKSVSITSLNSGSSDSSQRSHNRRPNMAHSRPYVQTVQPFAEAPMLKPLLEGTQELVYISHIVNPHNFYVQRACHQSIVKDLLRQFRNSVSLPKPSVNHIAEGKIYLAFNKADNMWQRCRVISVDRKNPVEPLCQVFCFDFGSTETVNFDKLRLIPQSSINSPNPLAINCSLANCVPAAGTWTSDDSFLIHNIIDNKQVVIFVRNVLPAGVEGEVTLECDVTTFEDGISLAHALVFHERAKMLNHRLKYVQHTGVREKTKIFISHDDYKYKSTEEVFITHIVNPDKFYVRKRHQQSLYEQLSLEMEQEYSLAVNTGSVYLPELGMSCCVHVPEQFRGAGGAVACGGAWARALVTSLPGRGRVALALVDSGAPLLAHWSTTRYLHPRFATLRALSTECHLAGVTPLNKKWSASSLALMQKYSDRLLELRVEDNRNRGSIGVTLLDHTDPDNVVCVNQEMIKNKFAITFGIYSFNKTDTADQVLTNKSPLDKPVRHTKPKPEVQILKKTTSNEQQKVKANTDLEAKDKGPLRLEAKVLQYQSPSLIYISLAHQQKRFNELFEDMQKYYSKNEPIKKTNWQVGDKCCAICIQSQTWRRAVIVEIEEENAKLFYSDFASVETLPIASLAELTPEFASIGDAAIKCHLCGVMPAGQEWPSLTKEYLKELLDCYKRIFITKLGAFKNKSMPIEIWVYHTIQGSALEPNKSEWRCLNKKIIEQGLGVPDKSDEASYSTETKAEEGEEMVSFLNVTGSIHDWLQLEPLPTNQLPKFVSPSKSNTSFDNEDQNEHQETESSNVMFISDWLPPEHLANKEFTAVPTYVDNDGIIYLHDVSQQDTLDLIRKALDVRFKNPDPKAKFQKWVVGEPCVALYFLDNRYYRGRVLDVNNETSTCLIHYIDYGNEEHCSFTNMRKSLALHQIPTQAHKCILNRIVPIDNQWDRQTLDYMHKSIVEKQCNVKVGGDTVDGITPIELRIDKLWINDHLVDFEMATYKDGSKAVVRKFAPPKREEKIKNLIPSVTDSDPDFIIEDDNSSKSSSFEVSSIKAKNWNEMLEEEEDNNSVQSCYIAFSNDLEDEFKCDITMIRDTKTLELDIMHDDDTALMYEELFKDLQQDADAMPPINGIYENKACIALFQQDMMWYRACILEYSRTQEKVKVKYVDYGNIEVVDLADVREIHPEWAKLTPLSVTAQLHGVKLNPEVEVKVVVQAFEETFIEKGPFIAKTVDRDNPIPIVELRYQEGELVYEKLIEKGVYLKCE